MTFKPLTEARQKPEFMTWQKNQPVQPESLKANEEEELNRIKQDAYQKAYEEGMFAAKQEIALMKQQLTNLMTLLHKPLKLIDAEVEQELFNSLVWLTKECLNIELSAEPEKLEAIIKEIKPFWSLIKKEKRLYLNPLDVQEIKESFNEDSDSELIATLIEDDSLSRGEFRLKSDDSELDGRIAERFYSIVQQNLVG